jgi:phospholipid/cholesterol/gamma-HCH transport system permease protein
MEELAPARGLQFIGKKVLDAIAEIGQITFLVVDMAKSVISRQPATRLLVDQMGAIGVGSLGLVIIVSLFTGGVAAVQAAYQFQNVVPMRFLGAVILRSVIIELGPVLTALVVGGRVGAAIAAELGTMKVTEQIDALRAMGVNPIRYLVVPRVFAATIMLPVVTILSDAIAILGGFIVAVVTVKISPATYTNSLKDFFYTKDLMSGLIKALIFGNVIGTMGCFYGFATEGGAEGVGKATTRAVVSSCVLVLVLDYVLANVLFEIIFTKP